MFKRTILSIVVLSALIAGTAFAFQALRSKYRVDIPQGTDTRIVGGKRVLDFHGKKVTVDIPPMEIRTPEDKKRLMAIMREQLIKNPQVIEEMEQIKKDPQVIEKLKTQGEKWKEEEKKLALANIDRLEKEALDECAKSPWTEQEKQEFAKKIRETMQTRRTETVERISKLHY